jgi:hypothetical protein
MFKWPESSSQKVVRMHESKSERTPEQEGLRIGMISKSLSHMIDMVVSFLEEGSNVVVIDGVVDDIAFPPWLDEATIP